MMCHFWTSRGEYIGVVCVDMHYNCVYYFETGLQFPDADDEYDVPFLDEPRY
jgi:hypothetical protein